MIEDLLKKVLDYKVKFEDSDYTNSYGISIPRVTKILQETMDQSPLIKWANNIGRFQRKNYEEVLNNAANIGSTAHEQIEHYMKNILHSSQTYSVDETNIAYNGYLLWYNAISKVNQVSIIDIEKTLYNEYYGGTFDLLLRINSKNYLIDFKTSNYVSEKYFIQLAAYIMLINQKMNIPIDGCIILQLNKSKPGSNEYALSFDNDVHLEFINHCKECFLSMLYTYYNCHYVKEKYNEIF